MKLIKYALLATLFFTCSPFSLTNAWAATLTESPANVVQGGSVTATWSAIAAPTNRDWIGLYAPAAVDTAYIDWIYVNTCSKSGGASTPANGLCSFPIPSSLPNGTYELRLLANNGYTRLATSNQFNVNNVLPRFVDNGDGTISDTQTGLMWEKKTGSPGTFTDCTLFSCLDPHDVQNAYRWSSTISGSIPDGNLFTDFLTNINRADGASDDGQTQDRKNYSDWRIPTIAELRSIVDCTQPSCISPIFGATEAATTWSSTTVAGNPGDPPSSFAWTFSFLPGGSGLDADAKFDIYPARAVRGGR